MRKYIFATDFPCRISGTAPLFHVYCRSTTATYFEDDFGQPGERAARDEETGKTYYVPADMSYKEWKEAFVDGRGKSGLAEVNEKSIAKGAGSGIIKSEITKEEIQVHSVGKIDRDIYKCITDDIVTDEAIITDNQIQHIKDRHPEALEKALGNLKSALKTPDYIIADERHKNTGLVIKRINSGTDHTQIVLRICTSEDSEGYKNSVISSWEISEKRLQNYLKNKRILYKKE